MANAVKFYFCTLAKYESLESYDQNAVYFVTDARRIYKGTTLYGSEFTITETLPEKGTDDVLYFAKGTGIAYKYVGSEWKPVFLPFEENLSDSSLTVPTSKAVKNVIGIDYNTSNASGAIITTDSQGRHVLNNNYNPGIGLKFNGILMDSRVTTLNFSGTTTLTSEGNGTYKVQIGENQNAANWTKADGKYGNGTVKETISEKNVILPNVSKLLNDGQWEDNNSNIKYRLGSSKENAEWTAGKSIDTGLTNGEFAISSQNLIHFNEGETVWEVSLYGIDTNDNRVCILSTQFSDEVIYSADSKSATIKMTSDKYYGSTGDEITGDAKKAITGVISHEILSAAIEDHYPAAVGGRAAVQFKFNLNKSELLSGGGKFSFAISNGSYSYDSSDYFFIKGLKPSIGGVEVELVPSSVTTKFVSGIEYINSAKFDVTVSDITNLNNVAAVEKKLSGSSTYLANIPTGVTKSSLTDYSLAVDDVSIYSSSFNLAGSKSFGLSSNDGVSVKFKAINAYTTSDEKTSNKISGLLVNTFAETASTASYEEFKKENMRLTYAETYSDVIPTSGNWSSSIDLTDDDLQVIPGTGLVYPSNDYSSTNYTPSGNPNYSGCTGTRYFVRAMSSGTGTKFGGSFTFGNVSSMNNIAVAEISVDGKTWYDLKKSMGVGNGVQTAFNSEKLSFGLPGGVTFEGVTGLYLKIGLSGATSTITTIKFEA